MLKIKKTKPYQFRKLHDRSVGYKFYASRVLCTIALICGIVPTLAVLTYYNPYTNKASATTLSIDNISTMQEMRPGICYNMEIGDSATLTDTRDDSTYTIAKLSDGKCWMTQNLRIVDEEITPENSDITANFTIPNSTANFTGENNNAAYYPGDEIYGAYYSWYTATAGTGTQAMTSGDAASSICPKGWRLPKSDKNGDFQALYQNYPDATPSAFQTNDNKNGFWLGGDSVATGGAFFLAAGYVDTNGLTLTDSAGAYWSSTVNSANNARFLYFYNTYLNPILNNLKYRGHSVRCVTDSYAEADTNVIAIVVPPVISIDATSGMNKEVDPNLITKGEISATISANTAYSVQLSANKTSLTNSQASEEPTSTNSIPASSNVQTKTNAWGILNQDNSTYSAITTNPTTYYNTEEYNEEAQSTKHTFGIGVSISPTLPAGEYSTTVTITAVNN